MIQQGICSTWNFWSAHGLSVNRSNFVFSIRSAMKLNIGTGSSPSCFSHLLRLNERPLSRHGVPVLNRSSSKPRAFSESETVLLASPILPPFSFLRPTCISPRMNVPALRITDLDANSIPRVVRTPVILSSRSTTSSATFPWCSSIPGADSMIIFIRNW